MTTAMRPESAGSGPPRAVSADARPAWRRRGSDVLSFLRPALFGAYVGAFAYWVWRDGVVLDREQVIAWIVGGLMIAALGTGRSAGVLRDWLPLAVVLVAYDFTRGAADTLGLPVQYEALVRVEETLFAGVVPTVELQEALGPFSADQPPRWWEVPVSLVYVSHFIVPFAVPAVLWWRDRRRFLDWVRRFLTLTAAGLATYVLVPAAPPWLASRQGIIGPVERTTARGWAYLDLDVAGHLLDKGQGVVNLVAALPSLHAAYAALVAAFFWPGASALARVGLVAYPLAMGAALVVSGEHYVIDILLGWLYVAAVMAVWQRRAPLVTTDGDAGPR